MAIATARIAGPASRHGIEPAGRAPGEELALDPRYPRAQLGAVRAGADRLTVRGGERRAPLAATFETAPVFAGLLGE